MTTAFSQHGVRFDNHEAGDERRGECPFCGKKEHFYVNKNTSQWSCRRCGEGGGFQKFIQRIYTHALDYSKQSAPEMAALAKNRKLPVEAFGRYGVVYSSIGNHYLLPGWADPVTKKLGDLRMWAPESKGVKSTATCHAQLFGWEKIEKAKTVWVCEGEWDAIACDALLRACRVSASFVAVAVPGAATFKAEWVRLFVDKDVVLAYDNDEPGRKGAAKAYLALKGVTKNLRCIHWEEGRPSGWDVRDFVTDKGFAQSTYQALLALLHETPPGVAPDSAAGQALSDGGRFTPERDCRAEVISADMVYAGYRKWLHLPDSLVLDVLFGAVLANRRPGDPFWLFLIAPPGGTKTELLMSFDGAPGMVMQSSMKPASLISGQAMSGGADPSLLARLNNRILIVKDFTSVLSMPEMIREDVFGVLRDAYDGHVERSYGNGVVRRYRYKFGFIAGVTPAIEQYNTQHVGLGERFLGYRIPIAKGIRAQREYLQRAQGNEGREEQMRKELGELARGVLNHHYAEDPDIPEECGEALICAAQSVAVLRANVVRDKYTKEVTHRPYTELGTRLVKEFTKLAIGVAQFRGEHSVGESAMRAVRAVALGSMPTGARLVAKSLYHKLEGLPADVVAREIGLPRFPTVDRLLDNLRMVGAVEATSGKFPVWSLAEEMREALDHGGLFHI